MNRKRGVFVVVLILLGLLLNVNALDQSTPLSYNEAKYQEMKVSGDAPNFGCGDKNLNIDGVRSFDGCSFDSRGCAVYAVENDGGLAGDDDTDCAFKRVGGILTQDYQNFFHNAIGRSDNDAGACVLDWNWRSHDGNQYLCADDKFWHKCSRDSEEDPNQNTISSTYDKVYQCSYNEERGIPVWKELAGVDLDKDGFTDEMGDCNDNPSTNPSFCTEIKNASIFSSSVNDTTIPKTLFNSSTVP